MKMSPPKNGIYIITGEISLVVTAMKRNSRWTSHSHQVEEQDPLLNSFSQLKDILNHIPDLEAIEANVFLGPFLDVIRSEDTTGPITGLALTSINKFLSYGLIEAGHETSAAAIENIADAVTHARFVGTDPGSDEVVLMKILHVLRTLLLSPAGTQLTNESVCEIMQSCFRICFEMRLSELLRKSAENTLMDMVQLLFSRLPQFKEDAKWALNMKKLKMRAGSIDPRNKKKRHLAKGKLKKPSLQPVPEPKHNPNMDEQSAKETLDNEDANTVYASNEQLSEIGSETKENSTLEEGNVDGICIYPQIIATTPVAPGDTVVDIHESFKEASERDTMEEMKQEGDSYEPEQKEEADMANSDLSMKEDAELDADSAAHAVLLPVATESQPSDSESTAQGDASMDANEDYVNPKGVRFVPQQQTKEGHGPLIPYGLPCVRELFRFLISLINPYDRHNTDIMIHMGLTLLTAALESGADYVAYNNSLLMLVRDELCKNLFSLLQSERLSLFAGSLRVCFLLFESLRSHLKLQLEMYLTKLSSIIVSDSIRIGLEQREIALESVVQLWRIPGLVTELYLNYDCDLYCSNLFEDLTKLLSKNAFPVSGLFSTHLLSLDALLTVVDTVEQHCHSRILNTKAKESEKASDGSDSDSGWSSLPVSGYAVGQKILAKSHSDVKSKLKELNRTPQIRPNRMSVSTNLPSVEELAAIKQKKRLLIQGTEHFNTKPAKGITFLQEHGLLATPLDPDQVATFLKEDYKLDKKMIAEYICKKTNKAVLESFVYSYEFTNKRLDEALRMFLESFRLPGESPVISYLMEYFSEHWHQSNGNPFVNTDAAFTLTYAVIMLNVDQHNHNAKKQNIPMTIEEFKKNVSKCNGGNDFEAEMLEEIYYAIKSDEIVMPAEQTGIVKENYLWNVLLRRGATKEGSFVHAPTGSYDHDLFVLIWGPTVAALSFVFDKSLDETIVQKAISGFRKCAMISAHYGISDVFDNLVITLCKFTTLLSISECPDTVPVLFGQNMKAQLAAKTVFALAHRHADILREGWKNILDCMLQLYKAKLLPKTFIEVEDFLDPSGKLALIKEENASLPRTESGVLSYFSSYFSSEAPSQKGPSPEEQEVIKLSHACIKECDLEQLITETKFLRMDSLQELIKALIFASQSQDSNEMSPHGDEEAAVFFLELLIRVVLQNRDRVGPFWQSVRDHICNLMVNAEEHTFLVERAVVGLIRLAKRLLRRDEIASQVLLSLRMLLLVKPKVIHSVCRHVSYGIHELLRTNAANIHSAEDWYTLFTLLEIVGAGAHPPAILPTTSTIVDSRENMSDAGAQSDSELSSQPPTESDRGYTSDSELYDNNKHRSSADLDVRPILGNGSWLLVNKDEPEGTSTPTKKQDPVNQYNIAMNEPLGPHDTKSLVKSCETLAFIVRDTVHVTPHNFESCIHAIRVFVEASMDGGVRNKREPATPTNKNKKHHKGKRKDEHRMKKSRSMPLNTSGDYSDDEDDAKTGAYHSISIQVVADLLDLMHTLHTRAASIFGSWAEEEKNIDQSKQSIDAGAGALWLKCWCPILQGIARLCCDVRRQVRSQALTYLQRALLVHDLQTLSAIEWESCFNKVLFPLLHMLLANVSPADPGGVEETRMRGSTLLCKVFLQHLSPLLSLSTFTALWLTILDFMDKYMHADKSDLLFEAIPESLKNMLLVMDTASIFQNEGEQSQLWRLTWDRIDTFLPHLKDELFKTDQEPRLSNEKHLESSKDTQPLPTERAEEPKMPQEAADPPVVRAASPLMEENHTPVTGGYVLHPPLPTVSSVQIPASLAITHTVPTVPLLLNPDIIQAASIPYLSPQNTPERKQEAITSKQ